MKFNFTFLIALIFACTVARSQTQQGSIIAGGDISLSFENHKDEVGSTSTDVGKFTRIQFNPLFGYFFADGMAAGLSINLQSTKFKADASDFETLNSSSSIGPFFRYYHDSGLFGHASIGFGGGKSEVSSGGTTNESKQGLFTWMVGPGYAMFLSENLAVEGMIAFQSQTFTDKDADPEEKDIFTGPIIKIGFQIFIN